MKYLFFDLDGTLLGSRTRQLHPKAEAALHRLHRDGHRIFLCSGRSPEYLLQGIARQIPVDGIVGCAGGCVSIGQEIIRENAIPQPLLHDTLAYLRQYDFCYNLETRQHVYESENYAQVMQHLFGLFPAKAYDPEKERQQSATLPEKVFDPARDKVQKLTYALASGTLPESFSQVIEPHFHVNRFLNLPSFSFGELIPRDCTKADGIAAVLAYYGADWRDTIGFGDSMNDYQMICAVNQGIVWENAPEALKEKASGFFCDPDDGGIWLALRELGLCD